MVLILKAGMTGCARACVCWRQIDFAGKFESERMSRLEREGRILKQLSDHEHDVAADFETERVSPCENELYVEACLRCSDGEGGGGGGSVETGLKIRSLVDGPPCWPWRTGDSPRFGLVHLFGWRSEPPPMGRVEDREGKNDPVMSSTEGGSAGGGSAAVEACHSRIAKDATQD